MIEFYNKYFKKSYTTKVKQLIVDIINEQPKMRICNNIHLVSDIFLPKFNLFSEKLKEDKLKIGGVKVSVPTELPILDFQNEIILPVE